MSTHLTLDVGGASPLGRLGAEGTETAACGLLGTAGKSDPLDAAFEASVTGFTFDSGDVAISASRAVTTSASAFFTLGPYGSQIDESSKEAEWLTRALGDEGRWFTTWMAKGVEIVLCLSYLAPIAQSHEWRRVC